VRDRIDADVGDDPENRIEERLATGRSSGPSVVVGGRRHIGTNVPIAFGH
jgi:hypothetical protein